MQHLTSEQWIELAHLYFDTPAEYKLWKLGVNNKMPKVIFCCPSCKTKFSPLITPTICPNCKLPPGDAGVSLTHKGYTNTTFPFDV